MMNNLHICHDAVLTWDQQIQAAGAALKEKIGNAIVNPLTLLDAVGGGYDVGPMRGVLLRDKKWSPGRRITIGFIDGDPRLCDRVKAQANTWLNYIGLEFAWVQGNNVEDHRQADIRITFNRGGSWSYVGTDNLVIGKPHPTMQFGWLTLDSREDEVRRVTIHEFGHMLGLGHEQAHPTGSIPWNKPVVYDYYRRTNGWDHATVDSQVFSVYGTGQTNYSAYDKFSIMHYAIPAEMLTDASRTVPWNTNLSAIDIEFIGQQYPKAVPPPKPPNKKRDWEINGWYEGRTGKQLTYWPGTNSEGSGDYKRYGWWEIHANKQVTRHGPKGEF